MVHQFYAAYLLRKDLFLKDLKVKIRKEVNPSPPVVYDPVLNGN